MSGPRHPRAKRKILALCSLCGAAVLRIGPRGEPVELALWLGAGGKTVVVHAACKRRRRLGRKTS